MKKATSAKKSQSKKHPLKKPRQNFISIKDGDRYILMGFTLVDMHEYDIPVFKEKDLETGAYLHKTALEIIFEPDIAYNLSKKDLIQVSYFAGQASVHFPDVTLH